MFAKRIFTFFLFIGLIFSYQAQIDTLLIDEKVDTTSVEIETYFSPVTFFDGSYQEALAEAKRRNKPLFIDFYANWCFPCKQMDKNVFTNPKVYEHLNEKYISLKINVEFFEGMDVADTFHVKEYPTFIILDKRGNEKDRTTGYQSKDELMRLIGKF